MNETLQDWLARWAREAPERPAVIGGTSPISYAALSARTRALAAGFASLGIGKGDIVAAQLPNGLEFLLCYLAAGCVGASLQTIHMPYRGAEIETLLAHSKAVAAVCVARPRDSPAELILSLRANLPHLEHVIAVGGDAPAGVLAFASLAASCVRDHYGTRADAGDRFLLLYTSGTTAAPKGVPVDYRRFLTNARLSAAELKIDGASVLLSAAPFTHLYGLFSVNLALGAGASIAIMPAFTPAALAGAIDACRPTGLFVAPAHMAACLNEGLLTPERLACLQFVLISGSVCPPALALAVQQRLAHGKVLQLWGMSEMQAGTFTRPDDPLEVRTGTAGRASPGTELRIADGATPLAGAEGELQARGLSVFAGYLENAAATAASFTPDGWFRTGDLARLDALGNLTLTGRLKDVINRGGVKFNPTDIEATIERHPAVAQCAIVPMPDPVLGERACAFVVLKPGGAIDLDALREFLAAQSIAKLTWPERLEVIAEMPLTPTRKVKKAELVRRLLES